MLLLAKTLPEFNAFDLLEIPPLGHGLLVAHGSVGTIGTAVEAAAPGVGVRLHLSGGQGVHHFPQLPVHMAFQQPELAPAGNIPGKILFLIPFAAQPPGSRVVHGFENVLLRQQHPAALLWTVFLLGQRNVWRSGREILDPGPHPSFAQEGPALLQSKEVKKHLQAQPLL